VAAAVTAIATAARTTATAATATATAATAAAALATKPPVPHAAADSTCSRSKHVVLASFSKRVFVPVFFLFSANYKVIASKR